MRDVAVILAAGGTGTRFGSSKLWEMINDKYLFQYALDTLLEMFNPPQIFLVVPEGEWTQYRGYLDGAYTGLKIQLVKGGATRADSVTNALMAIPDTFHYVLVQDAARPFLTAKMVNDCIGYAKNNHVGVILASDVTDTIKRVDADQRVLETLDRSQLIAVQTPQVFEVDKLRKAYGVARTEGIVPTDDAGAYELMHYPVHYVLNTSQNLKVTYSRDLIPLKSRYEKQPITLSKEIQFLICLVSFLFLCACFILYKYPMIQLPLVVYALIPFVVGANLIFLDRAFRIFWVATILVSYLMLA